MNITSLLIFLISFYFRLLINAYDTNELMKNYPSPFTSNNKILGLILAFDLNHFDPLALIFNEYLTMCEAGWLPTVIIYSASEWGQTLRRYIKRHVYCYRIGGPIDIRILTYDPSIGIALGAEHRKYVAMEVNNYDVFVYHEDDILFKYSHLIAYLHETKKLHQLDSKNGLLYHSIGFQRYRHLHFQHGWGESDIIEQDLLEETPTFKPICVNDTDPYLVVEGNPHQAMWILTQQQIFMLQEKCLFLNYSSASREHMSSFSLFGESCQLTKLIPARHFMTFAVLHYYQQRHVSWKPVFLADDNMISGYHYYAIPKVKLETPSCWESLILETLAEQEQMLLLPNSTVYDNHLVDSNSSSTL